MPYTVYHTALYPDFATLLCRICRNESIDLRRRAKLSSIISPLDISTQSFARGVEPTTPCQPDCNTAGSITTGIIKSDVFCRNAYSNSRL